MHVLELIRALVLALAGAVACTSSWGWAAGAGAFSGIIFPWAVRFFRFRLFGRLIRLDMVLLLLALILGGVLQFPFALGAGSFALLLPNFLAAAVIATVVGVVLLELSERFPSLRLFESLFVGLLFCWPLFSSSGGQFTRPQWLGDWGMENGLKASSLLAFAGILAAIASMAALPRQMERMAGWKSITGRALGATVLIALGAVGAWLFFHLAGPVKSQTLPPSPPASFSGDPPPPPPPEPALIAAIQFTKVHLPTKRLGGYFFRASETASEIPSDSDVVESKIFYLDGSVAPLGLAGRSLFKPLPTPGGRFEKAEVVTTVVPKAEDMADIDSKNVRKVCDLELASANATEAPAEVSGILSLIRAAMEGREPVPAGGFLEQVQKGIRVKPERIESRALLALSVTDWLEQNGDFSSDEKKQVDSSVAAFVKNGMKGNSADFAKLADAVFQTAGIPSRVVEGFFHPVESVPLDRLLLTDSHRDTWVEVLTSKGNWIVLPIRPAKVSDREPPPPQEDMKQEIFDEIEKNLSEPAKPPTASANAIGGRGELVHLWFVPIIIVSGLALWWAVSIFLLPIERIRKADAEHSHRFALAESAKRAERFFRSREFGESWAAYSRSMATTLPAHARRFEKLLNFHREADCAPPPKGSTTAIQAYIFFAASTLFLPERLFPKKPSIPQKPEL